MTQLERLKIRLSSEFPDTCDSSQNTLLQELLESARLDILSRRFPYGYEWTTKLEPQYYNLQVELAIIKYNMQGVEGQSSHEESGISRVYKNTLLSQVIPKAKSI